VLTLPFDPAGVATGVTVVSETYLSSAVGVAELLRRHSVPLLPPHTPRLHPSPILAGGAAASLTTGTPSPASPHGILARACANQVEARQIERAAAERGNPKLPVGATTSASRGISL
jgi:hypothetical protein